MKNRRILVIPQMDSVGGGAACLAMVSRHGESHSYFRLYCLSRMKFDLRPFLDRGLSAAAVMVVLAHAWPVRDAAVRTAGQRDISRFEGQIRKKRRETV
jgi:hypothetical protein